ncbi:NAD(P)/FAD-dependent oxidoreductase [Saliterribacillus persicus]|uniref:Amine oxidase domain-containing protein n=1 Tax=Saliterribacillus persicus TaxID=930114 RepID=A0A368YFE6_9BACI|nr:FAD-dependent oxidoreductase [Saliterribacillus persicus]RCW76904.1 hypothetical protein DFR57_102179 [Saliterribacillus persicus]
MKIIIVGAGLSGIIAANEIDSAKHEVMLLEKSRSVGGRLATRRIGEGKADHGAQFFTTRTDIFKEITREWQKRGLVKEWFVDHYPRYMAINGMNALMKAEAEEMNVVLNQRVSQFEKKNQKMLVHTEAGSVYEGDTIIYTAPLPQAVEVLEQSDLEISNEFMTNAKSVQYQKCLIALVSLDKSIRVGENGIVTEDLPNGIEKIINNQQKGVSNTPILTVVMDGDWSEKRYDLEDEAIWEEILESFFEWIVEKDAIRSYQIKRWRYAQATSTIEGGFIQVDGLPIYLAGDSFIAPEDHATHTRIESAVLSGKSIADHINKLDNE